MNSLYNILPIDDYRRENIKFDGNIKKNIEKPYCKNWKELFDILLSN